ncbi:MAG: MurR/RpiR family transcriptional regulator [Ileibacterium sp.]|nr:MurR/RpiR family transcriptional regulator [Ileibacterium sp.]
MNTTGSILSMLIAYVNHHEERSNYTETARGLVNYFERIPEASLHEMAGLCLVSGATLNRFVKSLGYSSYADFKQACKNSEGSTVTYSFQEIQGNIEGIDPVFDRFKTAVVENIEFINENVNYEQLHAICSKIHQAKAVGFFGLEFASLIGQHFQTKMAECSKPVKIGSGFDRQLEIAKELPERSVAIIASLEGGYFRYRKPVVDELIRRKIPIITLTMDNAATGNPAFNEVMMAAKTNLDTEGRIALLYLVELIIMYYFIFYKQS